MPRYSFSLEDGFRNAPPDATEVLADNKAAMESARLIARDFARSVAAHGNLRVVVRNEVSDEIGDVPVRPDFR
jgi:hypothetical protein